MSCNCFNKLRVKEELPFTERISLSKCHCTSRYVVSEKRSKFSIEPTNNLDCIDKIKVDGCLITSTATKKCDYLFIYKENNANKTFIFVELKGIDLKTAIAQLDSSIELFEKNQLLQEVDVRGGIVFTAYPKDNGTYRLLKRKLELKYRNRLKSIKVEQQSTHLIYNYSTDIFKKG